MAKKTQFVCQTCGASHPKWLGKCSSCGQWNTMTEEKVQSGKPKSKAQTLNTGREPQVLADLEPDESPRIATGIDELDRVRGSGFVRGSSVLIGGEPGVGKSTLMLQVAAALASEGHGVLYCTAEESPEQLRLRSERLNLASKNLQVLGEADGDLALEWARKLKPDFVVVDSIQTQRRSEFDSAPGTVTQVREITAMWSDWARMHGTAVALVGHVTKEGSIAGPKVVEHLVDAVLLFEGDHGGDIRMIRSLKNRFGASGELGVFEMGGSGLLPVKDPSRLFLGEREGKVGGVSVCPVIRGSRPMMIELQALVTRSFFASPQRNATGLDPRRLALWIAVLEKRLGLGLSGFDVFMNSTGGVRLEDSAADLAAAAAIASSLRDIPVDPGTILIGEIGLTGEVRAVNGLDRRLAEAKQMSFKRAIIPAAGWKKSPVKGLDIIPVRTLDEAIIETIGNQQ